MRKVIKASAAIAAIVLIISCASAPAPKAASAQPAQSASSDRAKAIVQGGGEAGSPAAAAVQPAPAQPTPATSADQPAPAQGQLTPDEQAYLQNYLARLNYMVYYNEDSKIDPKLAKIAVSQANRYLFEKLGLSVIDFDQIEKNKKDQQTAYESETGGSIDLIQYLAQKFNADVYVEMDFALTNETRDSKFYASAQGSMKIYDTSTATLLGSVVLSSQTAFSPDSADAAATNAIASTVWQAMPKMIDQSKELLKNSLTRGIRYEVIIQKTPDSKQVSQLRRALAKKIREVEQVSYSPSSTKLYLYTFQKGDKVEDAMYDAGSAAGHERHQPRVLAGQVLHVRFRIVNNRSGPSARLARDPFRLREGVALLVQCGRSRAQGRRACRERPKEVIVKKILGILVVLLTLAAVVGCASKPTTNARQPARSDGQGLSSPDHRTQGHSLRPRLSQMDGCRYRRAQSRREAPRLREQICRHRPGDGKDLDGTQLAA